MMVTKAIKKKIKECLTTKTLNMDSAKIKETKQKSKKASSLCLAT